jgi:hypothetical protein
MSLPKGLTGAEALAGDVEALLTTSGAMPSSLTKVISSSKCSGQDGGAEPAALLRLHRLLPVARRKGLGFEGTLRFVGIASG